MSLMISHQTLLLNYQFFVTTTCTAISILLICNFSVQNNNLPEDDA